MMPCIGDTSTDTNSSTAPAIFLQLFFYHPPNFRALHGPNRSRMSEFKRIDFTGNFPFVTGLFCFLLGTAWGKEA